METLLFTLQICGYVIGRLGHQFVDLQINHYKIEDLQFADRHSSEICGFAIAE
jgi:hypothetical protein